MKKLPQELDIFDNFKEIEPSEAWEQSLFQRLNENQSTQTSRKFSILILFFILLNTVFILSVLKNTPPQYSEHGIALKTISKELLVSRE